jgi:tripartite-type tricarboxylate transporter receptor subunit TctC
VRARTRSAPGFTDLIGGQVQFGFDAVSISLPHVKAGRVRAIATTAPQRLAVLPDIAAAKETLPGFEVVNWARHRDSTRHAAPVIERLHAEIVKAMKIPDLREKLIAQGTDPSTAIRKASPPS